MLFTHQRTLRKQVHCTGKALHSGKDTTITFLPAPADSGIMFERTDVASGTGLIPAHYAAVVDTRFCSKLANGHGVSIGTVEHVMAALAGLGIDNAHILINGPEVPIMDGSSEPFVFLLECAGVSEQSALRRYIRVKKPVKVVQGDSWLVLEPHEGLVMDLAIDFGHAVIGKQSLEVDFSMTGFKNTLARARTFGFEEDVQRMREAGLALGGSLDNAVVVGRDAVLNEGGLRYANEFIRHKMLDCLGDLYLAGYQLLASVSGSKMGHGVNNLALRELFADASAWEEVTREKPEAEKYAPMVVPAHQQVGISLAS